MKKNYRKRVIASALVIGAMAGGVGMVSGQMVSAAESGDEKSESSNHKKPELSEEKKAEIKEKLDAMTEEERKEWLENHKPKDGERPERGKRKGKPANLTDEEWEQKKAELKEKLDAMTEVERKEWRENHRHKKDEQAEDSSTETPAEK